MRRLAHIIEKRVRGLQYGLVVGHTETLRLPTRLWLDRRVDVSFPDEHGVRTAFAEIILSDVYGLERRGRNAFRTILDLGANVGIFSIAARKIHRSAVIHAYEPNLALEPYLKVQLAAAEATWFPEAVADRLALGSLAVDDGESVQTRLTEDLSGGVPIVPLALAVERLGRVDFAKIDCEGSEWAMFADPAPWERIQELALEYHERPAHSAEDAVRILTELGFDPWAVSKGPGFGVILSSRRPA